MFPFDWYLSCLLVELLRQLHPDRVVANQLLRREHIVLAHRDAALLSGEDFGLHDLGVGHCEKLRQVDRPRQEKNHAECKSSKSQLPARVEF